VKRIALSSLLLAGLLLFGAAKLRFEQELTQEHRLAYFHVAKLDLALREQIGQGAFVAALSGFRSLVADVLWVSADTAYQRYDWARLVLLYNNVTTLQPRVVDFWDGAAWQTAWNAAKFFRTDPDQPREALRIRAERQYVQLGREYLERGVRNNPDSYKLHVSLAFLLKERARDDQASSDEYKIAATFPKALGWENRFAGYELAQVPGKEREAYEQLLTCYNRGREEWVPTLFKTLRALEEKLNIPTAQRVYIPPEKEPPANH
jgi:hypothetical protein